MAGFSRTYIDWRRLAARLEADKDELLAARSPLLTVVAERYGLKRDTLHSVLYRKKPDSSSGRAAFRRAYWHLRKIQLSGEWPG